MHHKISHIVPVVSVVFLNTSSQSFKNVLNEVSCSCSVRNSLSTAATEAIKKIAQKVIKSLTGSCY